MQVTLTKANFSAKFNTITVPLSNGKFPEYVDVVGRTKTIRFFADRDAAVRNEYWDGLYYEYTSPESSIKVVVTTAY